MPFATNNAQLKDAKEGRKGKSDNERAGGQFIKDSRVVGEISSGEIREKRQEPPGQQKSSRCFGAKLHVLAPRRAGIGLARW